MGLQNHTWGGFQIELYNIHNIYNNIHFTHHPILSKKPCPVIAELLQYAPPGPGLPHWRPSCSSNSRLTLERWQVGEFVLSQSIRLFVCLQLGELRLCKSVCLFVSWQLGELKRCKSVCLFFWQVGKLTPYLYLFVVNTSRLPTLSAAHSSCSAYGLVDKTLR